MRRVLALSIVIVCAFAAGREVAATECFPVVKYLQKHKPVRKGLVTAVDRTVDAVAVLLGTKRVDGQR
jgi:hypothetical protein